MSWGRLPVSEFCNSISPRKTYSCELPKDHKGKRCQAENLDRGGYVFWEKPEDMEPEQTPEPYDGIMWGDE